MGEIAKMVATPQRALTALALIASPVFLQSLQRHFSEQGMPPLKHSQYLFRHADLLHPHPVLWTTTALEAFPPSAVLVWRTGERHNQRVSAPGRAAQQRTRER